MPTVLDMRMNGASNFQPSSDQVDQASHAAAPEHYNMSKEAEHIVFVIAVLMGIIYGLKVLGRVIRHAK